MARAWWGMSLSRRLRALVFPLLFYSVLGAASGYMVWGAQHGERGLKAKALYAEQSIQLQADLADAQDVHRRWTRRVAAMSAQSLDRDLLDEEARAMLDRVGKNDVVVYIEKDKSR